MGTRQFPLRDDVACFFPIFIVVLSVGFFPIFTEVLSVGKNMLIIHENKTITFAE